MRESQRWHKPKCGCQPWQVSECRPQIHRPMLGSVPFKAIAFPGDTLSIGRMGLFIRGSHDRLSSIKVMGCEFLGSHSHAVRGLCATASGKQPGQQKIVEREIGTCGAVCMGAGSAHESFRGPQTGTTRQVSPFQEEEADSARRLDTQLSA